MKPLIVANWKMNPKSLKEAETLFNSFKKEIENFKNATVVVCPPFVYLPLLIRASASAKGYGGLAFGSQDCSWAKEGAYTGEISPLMLKNLGCKYVIVGHSERRINLKETDEIINKKTRATIEVRLTPILCVGESEKERKGGRANEVIKDQLEKALSGIPENKSLLIAYEPVWAIGTGRSCESKTAETVRLFIKETINKMFGLSVSKKLKILYGGSVNSKNARAYVKEAGFQGLLVGGASLNPQEFGKIVKGLEKS